MAYTMEAIMPDGTPWLQRSDDTSDYYASCDICGFNLEGQAPYRSNGQLAHEKCIESDCVYLGRLPE